MGPGEHGLKLGLLGFAAAVVLLWLRGSLDSAARKPHFLVIVF